MTKARECGRWRAERECTTRLHWRARRRRSSQADQTTEPLGAGDGAGEGRAENRHELLIAGDDRVNGTHRDEKELGVGG